MKVTLLLLFIVLADTVCAQDPLTVRRNASKIVSDLTASEMHGRGYVNDGDRLAASYIVSKLKEFGVSCFKEGMEQGFQFPVNSFPGEMSVVVDGKGLEPGVDYIVHPSSGGVQGSFSVERFSLKEFVEGAPALDVTSFVGKALLLDIPDTKDKDSLVLYQAITEMLMDSSPLIQLKGKLTWSVSQKASKYPLIEVLSDAWPDSVRYVDLDIENLFIPEHYTTNVIGYIKGKKKKKEYMVISAHYDHLGRMGRDAYFPGANDNASGIAMLLSLARYYSQNPPDRTVVFMAFAGEEAGLVGSHYYIDHPLFDLERIRFLLNLDILGTGDDGIMVVNASKEKDEYDQLVRINDRTDRLPAVKKRGPACNSDHCAFVGKRSPGILHLHIGWCFVLPRCYG